MGFKKNWDVASVAQQINAAAYECMSPYNDGFNSWGIKQDLYKMKWLIDDAIRRCPDFSPEKDWLKEQEKKKIVKILKDEHR